MKINTQTITIFYIQIIFQCRKRSKLLIQPKKLFIIVLFELKHNTDNLKHLNTSVYIINALTNIN
jgi:hypothetical protein